VPCGRRAGPRLRRLRRQLVLHDDRAGASAIYRRPFARIDGFAGFSPGNGALLARDSGAVAFAASAVNPALQYTWDFGDPDSGADDVGVGPQVSHAYGRVGYYPVTLSVTDGGAVVARRTQWITVDGPTPPGGRR
jgi:hypothetical protein